MNPKDNKNNSSAWFTSRTQSDGSNWKPQRMTAAHAINTTHQKPTEKNLPNIQLTPPRPPSSPGKSEPSPTPLSPYQGQEDWKVVGGQRRLSHNLVSPGYFGRQNVGLPLETTTLHAINEQGNAAGANGGHGNFANNGNNGAPPPAVYEFFNGRNHGARSLSFSVGQNNDLFDMMSPPPGLDDSMGSQHGAPQQPQMPTAQMGGLFLGGTYNTAATGSADNPFMNQQANQDPFHRRSSTFTGKVRPAWSQTNPSDLYLPEMSKQFNPSPYQSPRRSSFTNEMSNFDTNDIATRYFTRDPDLQERRHTLAAAMALNSPGIVENADQLKNFAQNYGSIIDSPDSPNPASKRTVSNASTVNGRSLNSNASNTSATNGTHPSPAKQQSHARKVAAEEDDPRIRSWSEPNKLFAGPKKSSSKGAKKFYLVEFKGGRSDVFYVPENGELQVKTGDLVIVEADRGKDLGKIVRDNLTRDDLADSGGSKPPEPKAIHRHAQPAEVNMLLDKARDEAKSLAICKAKCKQKGLDMEVVDAEYQWDRKKLTFFFLAEKRIDFRELVKDLFKIYKTRIWMCKYGFEDKKSLHVKNESDDHHPEEDN